MAYFNDILLIYGILSVIVFNSTFAQRGTTPECLHRCGNGRCILDQYICDGYSDCPDDSDEQNCPENIDESGCIVPEFPENGYFLSENTTNFTNPGDILPEFAVLKLKCNDSQLTFKTFCQNSQWNVDLICPSTCPQLRTQHTVNAVCCNENGIDNQCDHPQLEGTVARFTCKPGYEAELLNSIQCNGTTWEGKIPKCKRSNWKDTCVLPPKIDNGEYSLGKDMFLYTPGDVVPDTAVLVYFCTDDHDVDADKISFCVNGTWTSSPKCRRFCDSLASPTVEYSCKEPSGRTSSCESQVPSGTIASSRCKTRYRPATPLVQLRCDDGVWDNPTPKCSIQSGVGIAAWFGLKKGPCLMPEDPPNGRYIAGANRDVSPGDELPNYSLLITECNKGYAPTLRDDDLIYCLGDNMWTELIKCQKKCPPLIVPHVKFTCEIENRDTWPYSKKKISCLEPMNHGSVASGDCKPSFFSDSIIPERTCVEGVWDKPSPVCKPKQWGQFIPTATNGSCVLPDHDVHGQYVYSKDTELTTGDAVPDFSIIIHTCYEGYDLNEQNFSLCQNGSWYTIPKCLKTCEPLKSITVDLICRHGGVIVNCMNPLKNGTTVESNCKESYSPSVAVLPIMVCINGNWDKEPPKCTPECGTITPKGQKNIINGTSTELGEFPWHVGLYDISQNYIQICGGSIVNAMVVITAAHCVWDDEGKRPSSEYAVAGVKYYREWKSDNDNEKLIQRSMVSEIVLPDNYGGDAQRQQADIALLILRTPFKFNSFIRPVCLDWDNAVDKLHLSHGNFGKVTGWGITDATNPNSGSPVLLSLKLPYIDYKQCRNETPREFATYLGVDKICAGYKDEGTAVCRGDSGGGLVFVSFVHSIERWYLRGIVSVGPKDELNPDTCHSELYTGFTHVLSHAEWLKREIYKRTPY